MGYLEKENKGRGRNKTTSKWFLSSGHRLSVDGLGWSQTKMQTEETSHPKLNLPIGLCFFGM